LSDRTLKTGFAAVDSRDVLQKLVSLPVSTWSYTAQGTGVKHLGPTAQDFRATFGLGEDDTTISVVDEQGVALAAIQGLHAPTQAQNAELRQQVDTLHGEVADLRATVESLRAQPNGATAPGSPPELPL